MGREKNRSLGSGLWIKMGLASESSAQVLQYNWLKVYLLVLVNLNIRSSLLPNLVKSVTKTFRFLFVGLMAYVQGSEV